MVAFLYPNGERNGQGEAILSFDSASLSLSVSLLSSTLPMKETPQAMVAKAKEGKVSELLDLVEKIARKSKEDASLKAMFRKYPLPFLVDYLVVSLCAIYLDEKSLSAEKHRVKIRKTSEDLFLLLYNLVPIGEKKDDSDCIEAFAYDFIDFMKAENSSFEDSLMLFWSSLEAPIDIQSYTNMIHFDTLALADAYISERYVKGRNDPKTFKSKKEAYLFSRPPVDLIENKVVYDNADRRFSREAFISLLVKHSKVQTLREDKKRSLYEQQLLDLESNGEIILRDDYFYLTGKGMGFCGYFVPKVFESIH